MSVIEATWKFQQGVIGRVVALQECECGWRGETVLRLSEYEAKGLVYTTCPRCTEALTAGTRLRLETVGGDSSLTTR